ncbi:prospero homeobox protein 2-like isoform X2 [Stigmatopora nigra]
MNLSMWSKMAYPGNRMDDHATEHLPPLECQSQKLFSKKSSEVNRMLLESLYRHGGESQASAVQRSGHQAKRARVENIIRGMATGSSGWEMKEDPQVNHKRYSSQLLPDDPTWKNCSSDVTPRNQESYREFENLAHGGYPGCEKKRQQDPMAPFLKNLKPSMGSNELLDVQTEALALVVQRPDHLGSQVHRLSPYQDRESDQTLNPESGVGSGSLTAVDPRILDNLCFPRIKTGSNGIHQGHLYVLNEGLTTKHLKKAKLMFFYTRYPSSLVLKTCFRDVRFRRCIASQLVKWFSNFREFYYIQMEKFARHVAAAAEAGTAHAKLALSVGRESELFRALNGHFNKGGDFQVPDGFLEVAEITLREFYVAISANKDRDPSWKKTIYKIISKLDADVPAPFKTWPRTEEPCGTIGSHRGQCRENEDSICKNQ